MRIVYARAWHFSHGTYYRNFYTGEGTSEGGFSRLEGPPPLTEVESSLLVSMGSCADPPAEVVAASTLGFFSFLGLSLYSVMTKVTASTVTLWCVAFFLSMLRSFARVPGVLVFRSFGVALGSLGLRELFAELEGGVDWLEGPGSGSGVEGVGGTSEFAGDATSVLFTGVSLLLLLALLPGRVRLPSSRADRSSYLELFELL